VAIPYSPTFLAQVRAASLTSATANGGGDAFFAHVGGFAFGALVTLGLLNTDRVLPQSSSGRAALAPF